ncbi:MAG: class I SAM-dependent methyltransferase [Bacillota bacterium]
MMDKHLETKKHFRIFLRGGSMYRNRRRRERAFWDRFAWLYDRFMKSSSGLYEKVFELLRQELQAEFVLLDLAVGTGLLALKMAPQIKKVYGVDISPEMVGQAKVKSRASRITNVEFSVGDAYRLPFDSIMFDVVLISNALHVMIEPEQALSEAYRVLKTDGRLIVPTFCHGENRLSRFVSWVMSRFGFEAFQRWSIGGFEQFIAANHFKVLQKVILKDIIPLTYIVAEKKTN